jgi:hypothetical protein
MGNRISTAPDERGQWRPLPRQPRILVVLDLCQRTVEQVNEAKVSISRDSVQRDGTEDEDCEWKFAGDRGDRPISDPMKDLRPIGVKSKF